MKLRNIVKALVVALGGGLVGLPALATTAPRSAVDDIRRQLLQLPYYGVFDFLSFKYDQGTATLMGYAHRPFLKADAERAVRRVTDG